MKIYLRKFHWFLLLLFFVLAISCISFYSLLNEQIESVESHSKPINHTLWTHLLSKYVSSDGLFDYNGFQTEKNVLEAYLELLSKHHPNDQYWTREEQLAYWINAYNAFTIKLVSDHYPVESIKEIKKGIPFVNSVWDIKFIKIENELYDLNNIEHGILRQKFNEPRIHFAINCASVSCPRLLSEAFSADQLEEQLAFATTLFLDDPTKNQLKEKNLRLSKIFKWFKNDFTKDGSLVEFINKELNLSLSSSAKVDFMDYDWSLNEVQGQH